MFKWCTQEFGYYPNKIWVLVQNGSEITACFKRKDDALRFKLQWG